MESMVHTSYVEILYNTVNKNMRFLQGWKNEATDHCNRFNARMQRKNGLSLSRKTVVKLKCYFME